MAVKLQRTGSALVLGAAAGVLDSSQAPIAIPGGGFGGVTQIGVGTAVEIAALALGTGMQIWQPFTAPDIVDGLVDGSVALLGAKVGGRIGVTMATPAGTPSTRFQQVRGWAQQQQVAAGNARPQAGIIVPQQVKRIA